MKSILLLPVAMVAISLHGQTSAVHPILGARVNAELTKRIDAKKAKVGDTVEAKTTSAVKLPDGNRASEGNKVGREDNRCEGEVKLRQDIAYCLQCG